MNMNMNMALWPCECDMLQFVKAPRHLRGNTRQHVAVKGQHHLFKS